MGRTLTLAAILAVAFVSKAGASIVLDQAHVLTEFVSQASLGGSIKQNVGQTIRVGVTGQLVRLELWADRGSGGGPDGSELIVDIRMTEADGSPSESSSAILAQVAIPRSEVSPLLGDPPDIGPLLLSIDLTSSGLFFEAGDTFAFNASTNDENLSFGVHGNFGPIETSGLYSDGRAFLRRNDVFSGEFYEWEAPGISVDLGFRTFVDAAPIPEPSGIAIWSLLAGVGLVALRLRRPSAV